MTFDPGSGIPSIASYTYRPLLCLGSPLLALDQLVPWEVGTRVSGVSPLCSYMLRVLYE